jgi:benzoyl-CoA 2,3-dioxygenase component B
VISAEKIPNNVNLSGNKRLQRALEHWQPKYIQWWRDMGPQGFQDYHQVYVRTATSVDPEGWAHFEYVKLPEYRWGIFLADPVHDRRIGFGDFFGQPVWQEVPEPLRPAQSVSGERRGRASPVGDGLPAAFVFRARRPR